MPSVFKGFVQCNKLYGSAAYGQTAVSPPATRAVKLEVWRYPRVLPSPHLSGIRVEEAIPLWHCPAWGHRPHTYSTAFLLCQGSRKVSGHTVVFVLQWVGCSYWPYHSWQKVGGGGNRSGRPTAGSRGEMSAGDERGRGVIKEGHHLIFLQELSPPPIYRL